MKTIKTLCTLSILLLILSCGKEEITATESIDSTNLVITSKPLTIKSELVEKEAAFGNRAFHTSLVHKKSIWIMAGQVSSGNSNNGFKPSDVWKSEDGTSWKLVNSKADFPPRSDHAATVYDDRMWLVGGADGLLYINDTLYNDVWHSKNGKDWLPTTKKAAFTPRSGHTLNTFKNRMWLIGGKNTTDGVELNRDVWVSGDGEIWSLATANAPFGERTNHSAVVHDNKLWVIGGYGKDQDSSNSDFKNDVWYTANGFTWVQATSNANFSPRSRLTSVSYDGYLWVIGGQVGQGKYLNDIWRSSDGIFWTKVKEIEGFGKRSEHTSVVFDKRFWAMGGHPLISYPTKDGVFTQGRYSDVWAFH